MHVNMKMTLKVNKKSSVKIMRLEEKKIKGEHSYHGKDEASSMTLMPMDKRVRFIREWGKASYITTHLEASKKEELGSHA